MLVEPAALDEFHGEVGLAGMIAQLEDFHDVGVPHARRGLGLNAKPGLLLRACQCSVANHLERDDSPQFRLPCLVHDAHAAPAQFLEYLVTRNHRPIHWVRPPRRPVMRGRLLIHGTTCIQSAQCLFLPPSRRLREEGQG